MINLLNFMKKHKFWMLVISILIFAIPIIIVHILYKIDCKFAWLQSEWSAGDVLTYIAGFEAFIGTVSLGLLAFWQNHQIQIQHMESLEPLLSMNLLCDDGILYLIIENTGGVEAKDINIRVLNISNNGTNKLDLDGLFETDFELYPNEMAKGRIAISEMNIKTETFPKVKLKVSYRRSDLNRTKEYERSVIYNRKIPVDTHYKIKEISSDIDRIARANVRIANYLDGHQVAKFDKLDILADRSLKNDLNDVLNKKKETPICDRRQTITKSLRKKSQED